MNLDWNKLIENVLTVPGSLNNTYCRFYNYSLLNKLHLMWQGVNEPVATYKGWLEVGRQVKKGEKAKFIIRPIHYKDKVDPNKVVLGGFKPVNCIFSLSQTSGEDIKFETKQWDKSKALSVLGIKEVPFDFIDGNSQGFCSEDGISVNPVAKHPEKTLFHEMAHYLMGHVKSDESKDIKEFQAETTAHILMKELGLNFDESESRAYVQGWLNTKPSDGHIKGIFKVVDQIIRAGTESEVEA